MTATAIDGTPAAGPGLDAALAAPWARFWARALDLQIGVAVGVVLALFILPSTLLAYGWGGKLVLWMVAVPLGLVVDAAIQGVAGTTLGKALAGVKLRTAGGKKPRFAEALRRNAGIYVKGLWLGVPILSLVPLATAYRRVTAGRMTRWDESLNTRVTLNGGGAVRTSVAGALVVGLSALVVWSSLPGTAGQMTPAEELEFVLPEMNKDLPRRIDDTLTLDRIGFRDDVLTYNYTVTGPETVEQIRSELEALGFRNRVAEAYCGNAQLARARASGVGAHYAYVLPDKTPVVAYDLGPDDCAP